MTWLRFLVLVQGAVGLYVIGRLVIRGYRKHRGLWDRASWTRFLLTVAGALTTLSLPVIVELGVVLRYYSRDGMTSNQLGLWALLALSAMFAGAFVLFGALFRFANSEAGTRFDFSSWRGGGRVTVSRSSAA